MIVRARAATAAILLFAMALAGCATHPAPDLARLYQAHAADRHQVPVIIIPGLMGSRLAHRETGVEAWPGTTRQLLTSGYLELALRIDPETLEPKDDGLVASGLFDGAVGLDFYGKIVKALQESGGYRQARPGTPAVRGEAQLYTLTYDWRQDIATTVRKLDELIEQIRRDYDDPMLRVDIIGHSMGGLIVRYYERYGTDDVLDGDSFLVTGAGVQKLRRLVLIGTPNQGSVSTIHSFLNGHRVALSRLPPEGVATMPAMYQLFPHSLSTWITTTRGEPLKLDLFNAELWRRFGWSVFNRQVQRRMADRPGVFPAQDVFERYFEKRLERAQRFAWSLSVPTGEVELIEPLQFGGDCIPTLARLVIEEVGGDSVARLLPEQILKPVPGIDYDKLMFEPGDGSVTKSSLLGRQALDPSIPRHENANTEFDKAFFVCEEHGTLTGNVHFLDNLLHYLLSAD
jgi:pimeloyl-ACP methyl ester carboxylesterase